MSEFDFSSWYVLLAIFITHYYRISQTLENLQKEQGELATAFAESASGQTSPTGMESRAQMAKKALWNIDTITLHILVLAIMTACGLILFNFQGLLDASEFGPLAESMTLVERLIYAFISLLFLLQYISKAGIPSWKTIKLLRKIKKEDN